MDKYCIPKDIFDIAALESCWEALANSNDFEEEYFCLLTSKTCQLFFEFRKSDTVPKEMIPMLAYMRIFAYKVQNRVDVIENIAAAVADDLVWQLSNHFRSIYKLGDIEESNLINIQYKDKNYAIDKSTFDLYPIKEDIYVEI